jgi:hypothetical protein
LGPFRGTTNSPPREKKNFTRGERELLLPRDEDEQHTVAKVSAEEIPSPFADDHALSGGPDREGLTSPFTADSGEGRSDSRAAESPGAERVRAHLQSLGYSSAVVLEVIRRLHDGVENPEAWGSSITPEIERGRSRFGRSRQAGGSGPMPCWMDIRDNQRKVAEERERGYKPPDWRKEVVPA